MASRTSIEWCDATVSALRSEVLPNAAQIARDKGYASLVQIAEKMAGHVGPHCERCSPGCEHCYSETNNGRCLPYNGTGLPFDRRSRDLVRTFNDQRILTQPLRWNKSKRIFWESQTDLFGEWVPDELIDEHFAGGERHGLLFDGERDVQQEGLCDRSSQIGISAFQRTNTTGNDNQPYRWPEKKQPSGQFGACDLFAAANPCNECAGDLSRLQSVRREELHGEIIGGGGNCHQGVVCAAEANPEGVSDRVWGCIPDDFKDSSRGEQSYGDRPNSGLHFTEKQSGTPENRNRAISLIVFGCESGPKRRPCRLEWIQGGVAECEWSGVAAFVKQVSINGRVSHDMDEWPNALRVRQLPEVER